MSKKWIHKMELVDACLYCHKVQSAAEKKFKWCSGCMAAKYCSVECQKKDWQDHKIECSSNLGINGIKTENHKEIKHFLSITSDFLGSYCYYHTKMVKKSIRQKRGPGGGIECIFIKKEMEYWAIISVNYDKVPHTFGKEYLLIKVIYSCGENSYSLNSHYPMDAAVTNPTLQVIKKFATNSLICICCNFDMNNLNITVLSREKTNELEKMEYLMNCKRKLTDYTKDGL